MSKLDQLRELLPWKRKGYEVLGEYQAAEQGDQRILDMMTETGADLSRERHVVHYLYFPHEEARSAAEENLHENGYGTRHGVDYGDVRPKSLIVERIGIVNEAIVSNERELLTAIAETNGGEYDGWEAALD